MVILATLSGLNNAMSVLSSGAAGTISPAQWRAAPGGTHCVDDLLPSLYYCVSTYVRVNIVPTTSIRARGNCGASKGAGCISDTVFNTKFETSPNRQATFSQHGLGLLS